MKRKRLELSQRYATALRKHLVAKSGLNFGPALALGQQAVSLGLATLDFARIHEQALVVLSPSSRQRGPIKRAERFFAEAVTPIVATHPAAQQCCMDMSRLKETLSRRTRELAVANHQLHRGMVRRKGIEAALKRKSEHYARLRRESRKRQGGLRRLTRKVLVTQEEDRTRISRELQNEIAQTLLGVNVRLHIFQQEARSNTEGLKNGIASTRQLVDESISSVRRLAREFGNS